MKLQELTKFDSSLKFIKNPEWPEEILAICALNELTAQGMVFIKNAKFLQKFLPHIDEAIAFKVGAVVDEKFYQLANAEMKSALEKLPWIVTSLQVPMSLTLL